MLKKTEKKKKKKNYVLSLHNVKKVKIFIKINLKNKTSYLYNILDSSRNSRIVFTCIKSQFETQIKMQSKKGISSISLDMKYDDSFCAG